MVGNCKVDKSPVRNVVERQCVQQKEFEIEFLVYVRDNFNDHSPYSSSSSKFESNCPNQSDGLNGLNEVNQIEWI